MIGRLFAAVLLTAAILVGFSSSAQAGCCGVITADGTRVRAQPNTRSVINGLAYDGDTFTFLTEYQTHELVRCSAGNSTPAWAKVRIHRTGVTGWVSACYSDPDTGR